MKKSFLLLLFLPLFYCSYLFKNQDHIIFAIRQLSQENPYPFSIPFVEGVETTVDNARLSSIYFKASPNGSISKKGLIFFLHGSGTNLAEIPESFPKKMLAKGYDFFAFDYRGFGKSQGALSEEALLEDAKQVYETWSKIYLEENIILYGRSLGTALATYVAKEHHPKQVILEAPFFSLLDMAYLEQPYLPRWAINCILAYPLRSDLWIEKISSPVTIIHGDQDLTVPMTEGKRLYEKISSKSNAQFIVFPDWGHEHFSDHPNFDNLIKCAIS